MTKNNLLVVYRDRKWAASRYEALTWSSTADFQTLEILMEDEVVIIPWDVIQYVRVPRLEDEDDSDESGE